MVLLILASAPQNFSDSPGLSGDGSLSVPTVTPGPQAAPQLSGGGSLATTVIPAPVVTPQLSGSGSLTVPTVIPAPLVTPQLSGGGSLAVPTVTPGPSVAPPLSGSGSLATVSTPSAGGTVGFSGSGSLRVGSSVAASGVATFSGSGQIAAPTPQPAVAVTVPLTGSGAVTAAPSLQWATSPQLAASGILSLSAAPNAPGIAPLSGDGALQSGSLIDTAGPVTFSGDSDLAVAATATARANLVLQTNSFETQADFDAVTVSVGYFLKANNAAGNNAARTGSYALDLWVNDSGSAELDYPVQGCVVGESYTTEIWFFPDGLTNLPTSLTLAVNGVSGGTTVAPLAAYAWQPIRFQWIATSPTATVTLAVAADPSLGPLGVLLDDWTVGLSSEVPPPTWTTTSDLTLRVSPRAPVTLPYTETFSLPDGPGWGSAWLYGPAPFSVGSSTNPGVIESGRAHITGYQSYLLQMPAISATDVTFTFTVDSSTGSGGVWFDLFLNANTYALPVSDEGSDFEFYFDATSGITGGIYQNDGEVVSNWNGTPFAFDTEYRMRAQSANGLARFKFWPAAEAEPDGWFLEGAWISPQNAGSVYFAPGTYYGTGTDSPSAWLDDITVAEYRTLETVGDLTATVTLTADAAPATEAAAALSGVGNLTSAQAPGGAGTTALSGTGGLSVPITVPTTSTTARVGMSLSPSAQASIPGITASAVQVQVGLSASSESEVATTAALTLSATISAQAGQETEGRFGINASLSATASSIVNRDIEFGILIGYGNSLRVFAEPIPDRDLRAQENPRRLAAENPTRTIHAEASPHVITTRSTHGTVHARGDSFKAQGFTTWTCSATAKSTFALSSQPHRLTVRSWKPQ